LRSFVKVFLSAMALIFLLTGICAEPLSASGVPSFAFHDSHVDCSIESYHLPMFFGINDTYTDCFSYSYAFAENADQYTNSKQKIILSDNTIVYDSINTVLKEQIKGDNVFMNTEVDTAADYQGGIGEICKIFINDFKGSNNERCENVNVIIIISSEGKVLLLGVLDSINRRLSQTEKEVLLFLDSVPNRWIPAKQGNRNVTSLLILPIRLHFE